MIGAYICRELQTGRTITSICKDKEVPSLPTVLNWLNLLHPNFNEEFFKSYTEARRVQAEVLADQNIDIADSDETREYIEEEYDGRKIYEISFFICPFEKKNLRLLIRILIQAIWSFRNR